MVFIIISPFCFFFFFHFEDEVFAKLISVLKIGHKYSLSFLFCFCFSSLNHLSAVYTFLRMRIILLLAVFLFLHGVLGSNVDISSPDFVSSLPKGMIALTDANFDELVFSSRLPSGSVNPFIIIFYAPWCGHCQHLIPLLVNFSVVSGLEHANIGLVNADEGNLRKRFNIQKYPEVFYTTGRQRETAADGKEENREALHSFMNVVTPVSVLDFSVRLRAVNSTTSVAQSVNSLDHLSSIVESYSQPFFLFFIPSKPSGNSEKWLEVIDIAASLNRNNFFVVEESILPQMEEEYNTTKKVHTLIKSARRCTSDPKARGPGGVVLLSSSDRYSSPQCFRSSKWLDSSNSYLDPSLMDFFLLNLANAVEEMTVMHWANARSAGRYLALVVLSPDLMRKDQNEKTLSEIREMIQQETFEETQSLQFGSEQNFRQSPSYMMWAYTNNTAHFSWLSRYGVSADELPDVVIIDLSRSRFFNLNKLNGLLQKGEGETFDNRSILDVKVVEQFAKGVLIGKYRASKLTFLEDLAERLSAFPVLSFLYEFLDRQETFFLVAVVFIGLFAIGWSLIIFLFWRHSRRDTTVKERAVEEEKKEK